METERPEWVTDEMIAEYERQYAATYAARCTRVMAEDLHEVLDWIDRLGQRAGVHPAGVENLRSALRPEMES